MNRHRRKQQAAHADRLSRVLAARDELARAAGLEPAALTGVDKLRYEQGAVLVVTRDGLHARAMAGDVSVVPLLERVNNLINEVVPPQAQALTVTFTQTIKERCPSCGFTRASADGPTIDPVTGKGIPDEPVITATKPATSPAVEPAEASTVVPLKKQKPEPPRSLAKMVADINAPPGMGRRSPTGWDDWRR